VKDTYNELDMDGTGPPVETALERAFTWLDDRFNPVLVKEVRQALRGKHFRSAFLFTVIVSVIVAVSIVLGSADAAAWNPIGPPFFVGIFACLTIAVVGFVPMAAFSSMGAEWEENTYDLLILSRLRPRHIVHGKLLGAGSQALLYFSIFTPYVAFTFLLGGVDLQLVLISVPLLAIISFALSAFAVCLSSLATKRTARVGYMIILAVSLVGACSGLIGGMAAATQVGIDLGDDEAKVILALLILLASVVAGFSIVIATSRLAHYEENRSSGLRVLTFVMAGMFMAWVSWAYSLIPATEFVWMMTTMAIGAVTLVGIFLVSERESLGMRVKHQLPANPLLRIFLLPWLPGGGRGTLWLVMTLTMICAWGGLILEGSTSFMATGLVSPSSTGMLSSGNMAALAVWSTGAYAVVYLCLPSAVFSNRSNSIGRTTLARALIPALFIGGLIVPPLIGFVTDNTDLLQGSHVGNPFLMVDRIERGMEDASMILVVAGAVLGLQFARIFRGVAEVTNAPLPGAMASADTGVALDRVNMAEESQGAEQDA
jgi:hypothetical protein